MDEINDVAIVVLSSQIPEEEGKASFTMSMSNTEQIYNKNGMSSDVTDSAMFKSAEAKYATDLSAGMASDAMGANEKVLNNLEQTIEEQAIEAQEEKAAQLKEEQAQRDAQRLENADSSATQQHVAASGAGANAQVSQQANVQVSASTSSNTEVKGEAPSVDAVEKTAPTSESLDTYV